MGGRARSGSAGTWPRFGRQIQRQLGELTYGAYSRRIWTVNLRRGRLLMLGSSSMLAQGELRVVPADVRMLHRFYIVIGL